MYIHRKKLISMGGFYKPKQKNIERLLKLAEQYGIKPDKKKRVNEKVNS